MNKIATLFVSGRENIDNVKLILQIKGKTILRFCETIVQIDTFFVLLLSVMSK